MPPKLHEAAADIDTDSTLFTDAWSTFGKVKVSNGNKRSADVTVTAVGGNYFDFHPLRLLSGNYIKADDLMKDRVLLDPDTAWLLFGGTELSGMSFSINGVPYVVAGVVEREDDRFSKKAAQTPVKIPIANGSKTIPAIARGEAAAAPLVPLTMEMTVKKTITPIISSIAASGINVFVTGPLV